MRIDIKTDKRIVDKDIKALYVLNFALNNFSTSRMKRANLRFIADREGYLLVKKPFQIKSKLEGMKE